ncbi:hypothetical protein NLX83_20025 [Allokutzneria sp. A3M-2-11 16]|uniref:hypothetical protein n=1 Tax=Allokutzneria sp. A3M-2-11 16 TaxID=2962043 RepID=UPI0020B63BAC|nr:hypothetical protein [Allokutzneria sp. A3M-2-11 16]MCP3801551.1 hypothetical protein [Allokutzneria sp. A3M-2-11 16]
MLARLLTPRWLVLHVLAVLWVVICCALGWWQWERSQSAGGSYLNLGYALQWPLFALFGVYMWVRTVRMQLAEDRGEAPQEPAEPAPAKPTSYGRRPVVTAAPDEADPELDEYNRYLRELRDQETR